MRTALLRMFIAAIAATTASCADSRAPVGPEAHVPAAAASQLLDSPVTVKVVTRNEPLATAQTVSQVIGALGGEITLPGTGLTVRFPAFALSQSTVITVTAVAGRNVAYEFEPHGTVFQAPVVVTQSLSGTSAWNGGLLSPALLAGYFADATALNASTPTALVSELLGVTVDPLSGSASFAITHFSGYLLGTGNTPSDSTGSSQ